MDAQDVDIVRQQPTPERGTFDVSSPLRGVVLCCTSIPAEKRTEIATQAEQMGAQHKYDLTSEVTHLIVGEYDTPKYRYVAKERPDVKVLKPDWIEAVRQLWIHDMAIDVKALEREYVWPAFAGLQVCMTGFEDPAERQAIVDLVQENGGDYHGDLTKQVTHLIAYRPEGAKYKHAKAWGIRLISLEWLHESVERGMILDEKLYSPEIPQEQRGQGAWTRTRSSKSPLGKRPRENSTANIEEGRRKLRRTASTKLLSQNENIWGDIVGGSGTIQAPNSFLCDPPQNSDGTKDSTVKTGGGNIFLNRTAKRGTFNGCNFYILGFDRRKSQVLNDHLFSHEGHIFGSLEEFIGNLLDRSYVVVPHDISASTLSQLPKEVLRTQLVTDWWIEQCLESKSFIEPCHCPFGRPFPKFPVDGFSGHTICSTGFVGMQLRHLSMAAALLGAKYDEMFTPEASVLVCDPRRPVRIEKLQSAKNWKIPAVSIDWLLESIEVGKWLAFGQYILRKKQLQKERSTPFGHETNVGVESEPAFIPEDLTESNSYSTKPHNSHNLKKAPKLDASAFDDDSPATLKEEESFTLQISKPAPAPVSEPLSEVSPNSRQKRSPKPTPIPAKDITNAISSLLAKSKSTLPHSFEVDSSKKRAPPRILGRAASNVSTGSRPLSRASSVDSTASHGNAVIWPSKAPPPDLKNFGGIIETGAEGAEGADSQPPPTQRLQYEDEESKEHKAQVMARMTGEKLQSRVKERTITVGSVAEMAGMGGNRNMRSLRDRSNGGGLR